MNLAELGHTCVVGLGWGDEGKGKIVDLLTERFDAVVRYNGGANAGHTVAFGGETFALHLVPSGVLRENVIGVIGPGVALDPVTILEEIDALHARGITLGGDRPRLRISNRAHVVMPYHKLEDSLSESQLPADRRIGTTARGIGPCYADKMNRSTALRVGDLLDRDALCDRLAPILERKNKIFEALYGQRVAQSADELADAYHALGRRLESFICDTTELLHELAAAGNRLLFEGAHGVMLDIDHGTFPYVSSSSSALGVAAGAGVPHQFVKSFMGVIKAYATRVGEGPFPSELADETGQRIRDAGNEYGTTTRRPRRCGWFDAVAVRYAAKLSGVSSIALMHLDTLTGFERIGVCVGYRCGDRTLVTFPADVRDQRRIEPIIEYCKGWTRDLRGVRHMPQLPSAAWDYVERLEKLIGVPIGIVSVGPNREQTILAGR